MDYSIPHNQSATFEPPQSVGGQGGAPDQSNRPLIKAAQRVSVESLPGDLLTHFISFLAPKDLASSALSSRVMHGAAQSATQQNPIFSAMRNFREVHLDAQDYPDSHTPIIQSFLATLDAEVLANKRFITYAIRLDASALAAYTGELSDEFICLVVNENLEAIQYVPSERFQNPALVAKLLAVFPVEKIDQLSEFLAEFPVEVLHTPDIQQILVDKFRNPALNMIDQNHELAYTLITAVFRFDFDYMRAAIQIDPAFLSAATDDLKDNKQFVLEVIENMFDIDHFDLMEHASPRLRTDPEIQEACVDKFRSLAFTELSELPADQITSGRFFEDMNDNRSYMLMAVAKNPSVIQHADVQLRDDLQLARTAVSRDGLAIQYCSDAIKNNKAVALIAMRNNPEAYVHLSSRLQRDVDINALRYTAYFNSLV